MKKNPFLRQLEKLSVPVPPAGEHKAILRKALHTRFYDSPSQTRFLNMFSWKLVPIGIMMLLIFCSGYFFFPGHTVRADALLHEAIQNIVQVSKERGEFLSEDTQFTLEILNRALQSGQLRYEGEQEFNGQKVPILSFYDDAIGHQMVISLWPHQSFDPTYATNYSLSLVRLDFLSQYAEEAISEYAQFDIENKQISHPDLLQQKMLDERLEDPFLKQLVKRENLETLAILESDMQRGSALCEEGMGGPDRDQQERFTRSGNLTDRELLEALRPLLSSAEVLTRNLLCKRDSNGHIYRFSLGFFALSKFQERRETARNFIQQTLEKFKNDYTPEARLKRQLLEKAFQSPTILKVSDRQVPLDAWITDEKGNAQREYRNVSALSFQAGNCSRVLNECTTVLLYVDPAATTFEGVSFEFVLPGGAENPHLTELEVRIREGKVQNMKELSSKFQDRSAPAGVQGLFRYQSNAMLRWMQDYGTEGARKLAQALEPLFKDSNVLIYWLLPSEANGSGVAGDLSNVSSVRLWVIPFAEILTQ